MGCLEALSSIHDTQTGAEFMASIRRSPTNRDSVSFAFAIEATDQLLVCFVGTLRVLISMDVVLDACAAKIPQFR